MEQIKYIIEDAISKGRAISLKNDTSLGRGVGFQTFNAIHFEILNQVQIGVIVPVIINTPATWSY